MSRSIAVLGLGKFGSSLAESLYSLGMDLMVVDRDPERIREFSSKSTVAVCANLENEEEIQALDLKHMDMVVVCMGTSLAPSVMCVLEAKNQGVPLVECPYFCTAVYDLDEPMILDYADLDSFVVLIGMSGQGLITDDEGHTTTLNEGETVLIPATTNTLKVEGTIKFLETYV